MAGVTGVTRFTLFSKDDGESEKEEKEKFLRAGGQTDGIEGSTRDSRWGKGTKRWCMCVLKITHFSRDIYGYLKASPQILFSSLRKKIVMCKILRSLKFESSEAVVEYYEIWKCNISTYQDGRNSQYLACHFLDGLIEEVNLKFTRLVSYI